MQTASHLREGLLSLQVLLDGMRPDMIQSVIRAPYSPVVCPSELVYMLLGCLDELFQLFRSIVGAAELPAHLCLYLCGRGQAWKTGKEAPDMGHEPMTLRLKV